jgi:hypothetical protein
MATTKEEVMKAKGSRRLVRWLGLALALAALTAPSAQAMLAEGVSGNPVQTTRPRLYADDLHEATPQSSVAVETRGYAPINELARPDLLSVSSDVESTSSSGFDWSDASIGAGITIVLLGFGAGILAARQTRRSRLSPV